MNLRRLERLREAAAQPSQVRLAQLALALADDGPLIEHFLREAPVIGGEARDGPLEVLRDEAVEFDELRRPRLGEAPALVELLARQLHEVLVDDVADVFEIA